MRLRLRAGVRVRVRLRLRARFICRMMPGWSGEPVIEKDLPLPVCP